MHASAHTLAKSLADAAQALGLDAMSALADELSARMAPAQAAAEDFSAASFAAARAATPKELRVEVDLKAVGEWAETTAATLHRALKETVETYAFQAGEIRHVEPGDHLDIAAAIGIGASTFEADRQQREDERFDRALARMTIEAAGARRLKPGDRLKFQAPDNHPLFTIEIVRKR